VLGARSYVRCTADREILPIAVENGYRRRRVSEAAKPCTNNDATAATSGCCGSGTGRSAATDSDRCGSGTRRTTATPRSARTAGATIATTAGTDIHPPDTALTHGGVPGGLHLAAD